MMHSDDINVQRQMRLLAVQFLILIPVATAGAIPAFLSGRNTLGGILSLMATLFGVGYVFSRTKYYLGAALLGLAIISIGSIFTVISSRPTESGQLFAGMAWVILAVLLSAFYLPDRGIVIFCLTLLVSIWFVSTGWLGLSGRDVSQTISFLTAVCGLVLGVSRYRTVLERDRQAELRQNRNELAIYAHQLEETLKELKLAQEKLVRQEKLAFLGQLAGSVGHELRNPLGVITNAVYFLKMVLDGSNETVTEYLNIIDTRVHESEKIVTDLLGLSRNRTAVRNQTAVSHLIDELVERYPPPENIQLKVNIADNIPDVMIDAQQIGQVLSNLITNAYQAMEEAGDCVYVTARAGIENVCIEVRDTGSGISPDILANIFEPLFTTKAKGIGLGLAVSKNLVKLNKGDIVAMSTLGEGTTFTLTLPQN